MPRWMTWLSFSLLLGGGPGLAEPDPQRQQELQALLIQDCGSCHGLRLKGGLGPPLRPEALAGKPAGLLVNTILEGRPGTAMPPWRAMLSEAEATWLVDRLQQGVVRP